MLRTQDKRLFLGSELSDIALGIEPVYTLPVTAGLLAHFDFSDLSSLTVSAGRVEQANDLSGNTNHATQVTAIERPRLCRAQNGELGGRDCLVFEPAQGPWDFDVTGVSASDMTSSWFAAGIISSIATNPKPIIGPTSDAGLEWRIDATTGVLSAVSADTAGIATSALAPTLDVGFATGLVLAADSATFYLNGATSGPIAHAVSFTAGRTAVIGWAPSVGSSPFQDRWNGFLGEIVCYSTTLSNDDALLVMRYLRSKWDTP